MIGDISLVNQFLAYDREIEPTTADYFRTLGLGTENEINAMRIRMQEKWRTFLTKRSELAVDANGLLNAEGSESYRFLFDSKNEGGGGWTRYNKDKKLDDKQRKSIAKRILQDRFYEIARKIFWRD